MPPEGRDTAYLWDMLDAALAIRQFLVEKDYEAYIQDRQLRNAVERNLEIIGEAARRLSTQCREENQQIPWRTIVGLRNIIAHEYDTVRQEIIWSHCQKHLPILVDRLNELGVGDL
jgi:uncharacterized protein with HEPN domain